MSAQVVVAARCHYCSRQLHPNEVLRLASGQQMCLRCHDWHYHALDVLSGAAVPRGCQLCELPMDTLHAAHRGLATRMFVIPIDGIYAVACLTCKEDYCRKRADLYKGTRFGHEDLKLS